MNALCYIPIVSTIFAAIILAKEKNNRDPFSNPVQERAFLSRMFIMLIPGINLLLSLIDLFATAVTHPIERAKRKQQA